MTGRKKREDASISDVIEDDPAVESSPIEVPSHEIEPLPPLATAALEAGPTEEPPPSFSIDFPVTPEPELASEPESKSDTASEPALDIDSKNNPGLADINLNMGEWTIPTGTDPASTESAHWHDIATRIDLARAYQEMGDNDGAREILEEVLREGDAKQQESARTMISNL